MKKVVIILLAAAVLFLAGACTTTQPVMAAVSFPDNCEVLGRVTLESKDSAASFARLLEEAQNLCPEADDVVNIIVDAKTTKTLFSTSYSYVMSGIAIKYAD